MKIGIQYNKKTLLPLVEGVMVDYNTQKKISYLPMFGKLRSQQVVLHAIPPVAKKGRVY
jgi:hypothetical protein